MNEVKIDKKVIQKIKSINQKKNWHHDIEYIDGEYVELVVEKYQKTKSEDLLAKILKNYEIYKMTWAKAFAPYLDNEIESGMALYDEIIWTSACKFDRSKILKRNGKAFNAYCVSACMNRLKNQMNSKKSCKHHPRIKCPICNEQVYQIDSKHLKHEYSLKRYKEEFINYPLVSTDGFVVCPITGNRVKKITEEYLNRIKWPDGTFGYYTPEDFKKEFKSIIPTGSFVCPITNIELNSISADYPKSIIKGYNQYLFANDFPNFKGLFKCPFSGKMILEANKEHLDSVLSQTENSGNKRKRMKSFNSLFPGITTEAIQVDVKNPYSGEMVRELTTIDFISNKTTIKEHLEKYCKEVMEKFCPQYIPCPFTGKPQKSIRRNYLRSIGRTVYDFYLAKCEYPVKKWNIKCAICGEYVDNIWTHLEKEKHTYSKRTTMDEFSRQYANYPLKSSVSTNSFYETDSGEVVHISDLLIRKIRGLDPLDIEDSLLSVAEDDMDRKIAKNIIQCKTMDDVLHYCREKKTIQKKEKMSNKDSIISSIGTDYDFVSSNGQLLEVLTPSKESIKNRVLRLYQSSDLMTEEENKRIQKYERN